MAPIFENLLLLGRPASGKSEFLDFMKQVPDADRVARYHIGRFNELDDFPWLWQKFMEDDVWQSAGYPRRYSFGGEDPGLHTEGAPLFDFCMAKFNAEYAASYRDHPEFYRDGTLILEFSRGGAHAYAKALGQLAPAILQRSAILFILVSYAESCRRNLARYQEKQKHSILAHRVPDDTMELYYQTHDWLDLTARRDAGLLTINGLHVPFVTVHNEPEVTDPVALDARYGPALRRLMEIRDGHV